MNYIALGCWSGNILHSDPWLQGPLAPYWVKKRIKKGPLQNKQTFASGFFELFTLPGSLKLNTQRRSEPSMRAFKEEERSVLISVTLIKGITGYKTVPADWHHVLMQVKGPTMWQRLERKISFLNCLFVCLLSAFLVIFLLTFFVIRIFLSVFSHPHPPSAGIRSAFYRHPPSFNILFVLSSYYISLFRGSALLSGLRKVHYLQKISDDFNYGHRKCPKIKPSEIFTRPKFLQYSIKLLSTFFGDVITYILGQHTWYT